jgi:polyketide synthase PksM
MEEEKFKAVFSSKVDVSVRMAQVFKEEILDFVLFFSSFQSFSKAPGQSNYASGCTFKDAFARQLASEWPCPVKVINWGYWGSVGIVASKDYNERIAKFGIGSIESDEAMEALEMLMSVPIDQIAFIKTTKPLDMEGINMDETFAVYPEDFSSSVRSIQDKISTVLKPFKLSDPIEPIGHEDTGRQIEKVREQLVEAVSRILQVKRDDIDVFAEFDDFGFDLIMQVELVKMLNSEFNIELTSVDVYGRNTLDNLAEYLVENYKEIIKSGGMEYQQRKEMNS